MKWAPAAGGLVVAAIAVAWATNAGQVPWSATRLLALFAAAGGSVGALVGAAVARDRRAALGATTVLGVTVGCFQRLPSAPGVVVVIVDCLGASRFTPALMPRTYALAESGYRFEYALSTSSWTRSAVGSLLTGTWPTKHGMYTLKPAPDRLREGVPTVAEAFSRGGFVTGMFADQAQLDPAFGLARGFDRYGFRDGAAPQLITHFLRWNRFARHAPRLAWLHFLDIHKPYTPAARYVPEGLPRPPGLVLEGTWGDLMTEVNTGQRTLAPDEWAYLRALHEAEIRELDDALGELWAALEADGTLASSWVVFTADHGEAFGEHGWFTHGGTPYQELLQVPLFVRPPGGRPPGAPALVEHPRGVDIAPTLLARVGLPALADVPGRDLGPALGGAARPDLDAYAEYFGEGTRELSVRHVEGEHAWTYVRSRTGEALYDLAADPAEHDDRAGTEPGVLEAQRARADAYLAQDRGSGAPAAGADPGTWAELGALGYVEE